jgi:4-alpha-glucanotransferase
VPPQPQPQPQPPHHTVEEFEDADENLPGDDGDGDGNPDAEPLHHIINVAGNLIHIRVAQIPSPQFQGTKTWIEEKQDGLSNEDQLSWQKFATIHALSKNNQLQIFSMDIEDEKKLTHIQNF